MRSSSGSGGEEGLRKLEENLYDLVLLDLGLPSMSGIEVLKELRRYDPKAKVIVVTGYPSVESIVVAMQNGAWDYMQKPVDVKILLKKISTALNAVSK